MNESTNYLKTDTAEARLRRCERWMPIAIISWLITIALATALLLTERRFAQDGSNTIRAHKLVIVDATGRERIVIAAPLPDPIVDGKSRKRRVSVSAAVQFKDADGTERGGIASEEDGSFMFGIDDERGHERAHLYYIPKRGSGVYLQSSKGGKNLSLLNPSDVNEKPKLEIMTETGTTVTEWPAQK